VKEIAKMLQQMQQMQKAFVDRPPMGESARAAQFPGPYAVPLPQYVQSGCAQLPPPMPLVLPPPWQQTLASGPTVMPAPQTVAPPTRRPGSATGLASNSAATRSFAPRRPSYSPRPTVCFGCGQSGHLRRDCPSAGAEPRPAASPATAVPPDKVQMASGEKDM